MAAASSLSKVAVCDVTKLVTDAPVGSDAAMTSNCGSTATVTVNGIIRWEDVGDDDDDDDDVDDCPADVALYADDVPVFDAWRFNL